MINQLILVGRITEIEQDNEIVVACSRTEKNEQGEYETDFIKVYLNNNISDSVKEYCKVGDLVGVKGRIESGNIIKALKVSFLSTAKE